MMGLFKSTITNFQLLDTYFDIGNIIRISPGVSGGGFCEILSRPQSTPPEHPQSLYELPFKIATVQLSPSSRRKKAINRRGRAGVPDLRSGAAGHTQTGQVFAGAAFEGGGEERSSC
jgi:hypothetical protein